MRLGEPSKDCRRCGATLPLNAFHKHSRHKDGLNSRCKECIRATKLEYYHAHQAQNPEYRERARLKTKAWWAKMTDAERREYVRVKNAKKSPEQRRKETRLYAARHPERRAVHAAKRDAKRKGAPVVEAVDRSVVWERDGGVCGICGELADKATWQLDHITPLARGGEHSYANSQVSHSFCNASKGAKVA